MREFQLKSTQFRKEREKSWRELERLVTVVEKRGVRALTAKELERLPQLYRHTISALSVARAISLDRGLLLYLESLSARAWFAVYGVKRMPADVVVEFFVRTFPATVRAFWRHMGLATIVLVIGILAGFELVQADPDRYYSFVPEGLVGGRTPTSTRAELEAVLYSVDHDAGELVFFSSFLWQNNARVGIMAFALGFLAGLPVLYLLFTTGLMVGAFWSIHHDKGLSADIWAWLLPHGITELGAIILCGGAGLVLGQAVVFPGVHTRMANLARQGRRAAMVVVGGVAMLFIAGVLEGVFRQVVRDMTSRYIVAGATAVAWGLYFTLAGRRRLS